MTLENSKFKIQNSKLGFIQTTSGFTLIELLVVISIIGILASLLFVSFTTSQKQARDAARKSDLKQYSTALEAFANANSGLYPSHTSTITLSSGSNTLCTDMNLNNCPGDSQVGYAYKYISNGTNGGATTPDATEYVLWAQLEGSDNYWVLCSNGRSGTSAITGWTDPVAGACPSGI